MTIRHLQIFNMVCDCGSITAAAEKLNMAQPAVSTAVKELESFYQTKLFDRLNRRIYLTEAGKILRQYSNTVLEQFDEATEVLRDQKKSKRCRFGVNVSVAETRLEEILRRLKEEMPDISLRVMVDNSHAVEEKLAANEIDFCIIDTLFDASHRVVIPLYTGEMMVVCSPDYREGDSMTVEELAGETLLLHEENSGNRICTDAVFQMYGLHVHPTVQSTSDWNLIGLAKRGFGITILPREVVAGELKNGTLKEIRVENTHFRRQYFIAYHEKKYLTHTVRRAIDIIRDI